MIIKIIKNNIIKIMIHFHKKKFINRNKRIIKIKTKKWSNIIS